MLNFRDDKKTVTDLDQCRIMRELVGTDKVGAKVKSPFQAVDNSPNCQIKENNGVLLLVDFKNRKSYNVVALTAELTICTYGEAFKKLINQQRLNPTIIKSIPKREILTYIPYYKNWSKVTRGYWENLGIDIKKFPVKVVEGYNLNGTDYWLNSMTFVYIYQCKDEDCEKYKFYSPAQNGRGKDFFGNAPSTITWHTINNSDTLLISKAAKEQMFFEEVFGDKFDYCHLQSESGYRSFIKQFLNYENFVLNFDNDSEGLKALKGLTNLLTELGKKVTPLICENGKNFTDIDLIESKKILEEWTK